MLDLNYVRENLDRVRAALEARGMPATALDDFAQADAERRQVIAESDALNAERNAASRAIGALMKQDRREEADALRKQAGELKDRIGELEQNREQAEARIRELLSTLPNIPHESVPVGKDESANIEIRRWGTKPEFDFAPKDHVDLGTSLGILDLERAVKIAGARFAILNGAGARKPCRRSSSTRRRCSAPDNCRSLKRTYSSSKMNAVSILFRPRKCR